MLSRTAPEAGVLVLASGLTSAWTERVESSRIADLGREQIADNALRLVQTLDGDRHDLVEGDLDSVKLEFSHGVDSFLR